MRPTLLAAAAAALTLAGASLVTAGARADVPSPEHWRLDPSFGQGGIVSTDFPGFGHRYAWGSDSLVQADGRAVVVGVASTGLQDDVAVARYRSNGTLDPSFGTGGRVTLGPHPYYRPTAVAIQRIGGEQKILVAVATTFRSPIRYRCSVIRLNADGSLDTADDSDPGIAFGREGVKVVSFPGNSGFCGGLVVNPSGSIVVTVEAASHGGDVGVFRLLPRDGALDPGFGDAGRVTLSAPGYQVPGPVVVQTRPAGPPRLVIGGLVSRAHGYDWALWRLRATGRPDPTFGQDGRTTTTMYDARVQQSFESVRALAVTDGGAIVASGDYRSWPDGADAPHDTAAVAEYSPDGRLDRAFGTSGRTHIPYDGRGDTSAVDVTIDSAGRIEYGGALSMPTSGLLLAGGFDAHGAPDPRFGDAGFLELLVGGGPYTGAASVQLDPAGRLVLAGIYGDPNGVADRFGVVRLRLAGGDATESG